MSSRVICATHDESHADGWAAGLSGELRAEIDALAAQLRRGPGITHWARAVARRAGGATEFLDRRPYCDGDDVRAIDWHAFAKTARPVVKRFAAEQSAQVNILLDRSLSMDSGTPNKLEASKGLASALAYLAVASESRVQVWYGRGGELQSLGSAASRSGLPRLWDALVRARTEGATELTPWLLQLCTRAKPGALFVVSDLLHETHPATALTEARVRGHDLAVFHVLSPQELEPEIDGDATLVSAESGKTLRVRFDSEQRSAYRARLQAWQQRWQADLQARGQRYQCLVAGDSAAPSLRAYVWSMLRRV